VRVILSSEHCDRWFSQSCPKRQDAADRAIPALTSHVNSSIDRSESHLALSRTSPSLHHFSAVFELLLRLLRASHWALPSRLIAPKAPLQHPNQLTMGMTTGFVSMRRCHTTAFLTCS
jgi:hypothetical protein